jgi:hypothetical protein
LRTDARKSYFLDPFLHTRHYRGQNLIQQLVIPLRQVVSPHIPKAREVLPESKQGGIFDTRGMANCHLRIWKNREFEILVQSDVFVNGFSVSAHCKYSSKVLSRDIFCSDVQLYAVTPRRCIENPSGIEAIVLKMYERAFSVS